MHLITLLLIFFSVFVVSIEETGLNENKLSSVESFQAEIYSKKSESDYNRLTVKEVFTYNSDGVFNVLAKNSTVNNTSDLLSIDLSFLGVLLYIRDVSEQFFVKLNRIIESPMNLSLISDTDEIRINPQKISFVVSERAHKSIELDSSKCSKKCFETTISIIDDNSNIILSCFKVRFSPIFSGQYCYFGLFLLLPFLIFALIEARCEMDSLTYYKLLPVGVVINSLTFFQYFLIIYTSFHSLSLENFGFFILLLPTTLIFSSIYSSKYLREITRFRFFTLFFCILLNNIYLLHLLVIFSLKKNNNTVSNLTNISLLNLSLFTSTFFNVVQMLLCCYINGQFNENNALLFSNHLVVSVVLSVISVIVSFILFILPNQNATFVEKVILNYLTLKRASKISALNKSRKKSFIIELFEKKGDETELTRRFSDSILINQFQEKDLSSSIAINIQDLEHLKFLLHYNTDLNISLPSGEHLVHKLSSFECPDLLDEAIKQGIDINCVDPNSGKTPLIIAIDNNCDKNTFFLLKHADCNVVDKLGNSPVSLALSHRNMDLLNLLIEFHANFDIFLNNGLHAIHEASKFDCPELISILINRGILINIQEPQRKRTPLHFAMENGCIENTRMLLANNADSEVRDSEDNTPIMLARMNQKSDMIRFINEISSRKLLEILPSVSNSSSVILPSMDLDPSTQPPRIWMKFLNALKSNHQLDLFLDTSGVRLSRKQVVQVVLILKERMKNFGLKKICCGLASEEIFSLTLIIQSREFSLQKLATEISTTNSLTEFQQNQTNSTIFQILYTLIAFLTSPYWLLLGIFDYIFHLRTKLRNTDSLDAFDSVFGIHSHGFGLYQQILFRRTFVMFCFFVSGSLIFLYPSFFISLFYSFLDKKIGYFLIISFLLLLIIIPLFIMQKIIWKDETLLRIDFPQSKITRITLRNCLAVGTVILDFIQLSALGFVTNRFHENSHFVFDFLQYGLLSFDFVDSTYIFFSSCILVIGWMLICSFIFYALFVQHPWLLRAIPRLNILISLLSNTLFLTIVKKILSILDCTIDETGKSTLDNSDSFECWTPLHRVYAIFGTILLILFIHACSVVGPFFHQSFKRSLEIHTITAFTSVERFIKVLLTFITVLLSNHQYRYIHIFSSLIFNALLVLLVFQYKPIDNIRLNQTKTILSLMTVWSNICYIIALSYGDQAKETWVPIIILLIGWMICLIILHIVIFFGYDKGLSFGVNEQVMLKHGTRSRKSFGSFYNSAKTSGVYS